MTDLPRTAVTGACACGQDVITVTDGETREQLVLDPDIDPAGTVVLYEFAGVVVARRRGEPAPLGRVEHQCAALSIDDVALVDQRDDPGLEQAGGWRA